jgi:hypothetical protein
MSDYQSSKLKEIKMLFDPLERHGPLLRFIACHQYGSIQTTRKVRIAAEGGRNARCASFYSLQEGLLQVTTSPIMPKSANPRGQAALNSIHPDRIATSAIADP